MFRKEARNANFFIALLYVCLVHKVIAQLCMGARSDNMIQFVNFFDITVCRIEKQYSLRRARIVPQFNFSCVILSVYRAFLFYLMIGKFQLLFSTSKKNHYFTF